MARGAQLVLGLVGVLSLSAATAGAEGLPACRVRAVRSTATEGVAKAVFDQVQAWVDARERGVTLLSSIDGADVLLEFADYRLKTMPDGTPAEEWRFIARRLSEPDAYRATHRFAYVTFLGRSTKAHVAKALPIVLTDVCFGYLPKVASGHQ